MSQSYVNPGRVKRGQNLPTIQNQQRKDQSLSNIINDLIKNEIGGYLIKDIKLTLPSLDGGP